MPFKSLAQEGYMHEHPEILGKAGLKEWDSATKGKHLPERKSMKKKSKTETVSLGKKGAFKVRKGALHRALGVPEGEKIPASKMAGHHSGKTGRMIDSAKGLEAMHHGGK